jgi:hypothetical protein
MNGVRIAYRGVLWRDGVGHLQQQLLMTPVYLLVGNVAVSKCFVELKQYFVISEPISSIL